MVFLLMVQSLTKILMETELMKESTWEFGAFAQVNTEVFDGFRFIGSLRYDKTKTMKVE